MSTRGELIKAHAVERLDREAAIHPKGHQNVHARRYFMQRPGKPDIEIMIIVKGTNLQLWCEVEAIDRIKGLAIGGEFRPGTETDQPDHTGKIQYGRHSGLKVMERLRNGDAWRFVPKTIGTFDDILDCIRRSGH